MAHKNKAQGSNRARHSKTINMRSNVMDETQSHGRHNLEAIMKLIIRPLLVLF